MGDMRPVLIDHAASFRRGAHVSMEHENAFQTGAGEDFFPVARDYWC